MRSFMKIGGGHQVSFPCKCWRDDKHSFLVIDKDRGINDGRFRKGFDNFAISIAYT